MCWVLLHTYRWMGVLVAAIRLYARYVPTIRFRRITAGDPGRIVMQKIKRRRCASQAFFAERTPGSKFRKMLNAASILTWFNRLMY